MTTFWPLDLIKRPKLIHARCRLGCYIWLINRCIRGLKPYIYTTNIKGLFGSFAWYYIYLVERARIPNKFVFGFFARVSSKNFSCFRERAKVTHDMFDLLPGIACLASLLGKACPARPREPN